MNAQLVKVASECVEHCILNTNAQTCVLQRLLNVIETINLRINVTKNVVPMKTGNWFWNRASASQNRVLILRTRSWKGKDLQNANHDLNRVFYPFLKICLQ